MIIYTYSSSVISTIHSALSTAVLGAATLVGPYVAIIAILVSIDLMEPSPVGIEHQLAVDLGTAASGRALRPRHLGVGLGSFRTDLLGCYSSKEGGENGCATHIEGYKRRH